MYGKRKTGNNGGNFGSNESWAGICLIERILSF
jgi:hypothetical protein